MTVPPCWSSSLHMTYHRLLLVTVSANVVSMIRLCSCVLHPLACRCCVFLPASWSCFCLCLILSVHCVSTLCMNAYLSVPVQACGQGPRCKCGDAGCGGGRGPSSLHLDPRRAWPRHSGASSYAPPCHLCTCRSSAPQRLMHALILPDDVGHSANDCNASAHHNQGQALPC